MNYHKPVLFLRERLMQRRKRLLALRCQNRQLLLQLQHAFSAQRRQQRHQKLAAFLLIPVLLSTSAPAMAAENQEQTAQQPAAAAVQDENTYTLVQIIQQVQQHNRIHQQYQLNLDLLEESHTKAKNTRRDVQRTLNAVYDQEADAYHSLDTVGKNQSAAMTAMEQIADGYKAQYLDALATGKMTAEQLQARIESDPRYMALMSQVVTYTGMESQLNSGISTAEDAIEQLWDGLDEVGSTLRTIENKQDDVNRSQADWQEQVKLLTNLLVRKTVAMEETQNLLEQKYALQQKQLDVSKKQEEIGLTVAVKTKDVQIALEETATQLQQVKDGVQLLKRQLNDMMGRSLDAPLHIEPVAELGYVAIAPTYSAQLLQQATANDYTLKTLQRDIDNAREDAQDLKDKGQYESDALKIYDLNIALSKVSIKDQQAAVDNDLKKLIDAVTVAGQTYSEKLDAWHNAETKYQQNQTYREVGLLSPLLFQAAELEYRQAALTRKQAAYDYALAKMEYEAFLNGTDLSIYEQYKGL